MKKIIFIILILYSNVLIADERKSELDKLFNDLKIDNASLSFETEQKIWKLWSTHPSDQKLTEMLSKGSDLVNNQKLNEAIIIFSKVIDLDPDWAEAWNKRATVLYLVGEYQESQNPKVGYYNKIIILIENLFASQIL